jgi:hypothetical protein
VLFVMWPGARGSRDVAGARKGKGGCGTGSRACDVAQCTSRLAWLCFLQACQKTSGLGPLSLVRISRRNTKRTRLPQATVNLGGRRVHICLIRDVWNVGRKLTQVNQPSESFVVERTLAIRCS